MIQSYIIKYDELLNLHFVIFSSQSNFDLNGGKSLILAILPFTNTVLNPDGLIHEILWFQSFIIQFQKGIMPFMRLLTNSFERFYKKSLINFSARISNQIFILNPVLSKNYFKNYFEFIYQ